MPDELNELRTIVEQHVRQFASLIRQTDHVRTPSLQQVEQERYPIPVYCGDRKTQTRLLSLFFFWARWYQCEEAVRYHTPTPITTKRSRTEMNDEYVKLIVDNCLRVWSALNKAVKCVRISDTVIEPRYHLKHVESEQHDRG